ncbi:FecR family protein [Paraflavitalea sp. CAU 1676]|uniref:FecR family protein n=1 Tax=Paraflavitalea sp. CAU 1676 TaxID=3032598 RepID=UPI0023D9AAE8|nr:FecR family protein [Paraflavitalea sp. CAU 1676]MDF2186844.1 FecR domain-containing protein [Paraflavitalea sp. CAU 1676]
MPQQRIYELIARKLSGEATEAELEELHSYLQQHGSDQYLYEILSAYWQQHPDEQQEQLSEEEQRFQRILQAPAPIDTSVIPMPAPVRTIRWRRWIGYAAAVVVLAGGSYFIYRNQHTRIPLVSSTDNQPISEVVANRGSRSRMVLPDGSQVWLNAGSRLTYQSSFNTERREVNLEGEAFFDVTHDASRPFIVHTSGIDIKVLGTAFNVKSYASDATIEATLLRGSIEVVKKNDPNAPKVILRPHEKLVFNKEETTASLAADPQPPTPDSNQPVQPGISVTMLPGNKPDSIIKETSWLYNKLNFNGDSFDELAIKMERWYDVKIIINNDKLKHSRLKGSFQTETVQKALEYLQIIVPFEYTINGREIIIN